MARKDLLQKMFGESPFLDADIDLLSELPLDRLSTKTTSMAAQYGKELEVLKSLVSEEVWKTYLKLGEMGWAAPPYTYFQIKEINKRCRRTEDEIDQTWSDLEELVDLGLVRPGMPELPTQDGEAPEEKTSMKQMGYRIVDPVISLHLFYLENKKLPHWVRDWLRKSQPKIELDTLEQDIISKIPSAGFLTSPKSRKLTYVRNKWFWLTAEQYGRNKQEQGLEQVMYILPENEQKAANKLKERELLVVYTHHYGMPVFIPNPDFFS